MLSIFSNFKGIYVIPNKIMVTNSQAKGLAIARALWGFILSCPSLKEKQLTSKVWEY